MPAAAFSTGGDLRLMKRATEHLARPRGGGRLIRDLALDPRAVRRHGPRLIANSDKAFVAAINGPAAGVGLAFALTCDIILAAERAVLVPAFGRLGLIPEVGTSWACAGRIGYQRAFEFYVGGSHVTAAEAAELGLVNHVVPDDELIATAREWAERIAALPAHGRADGEAAPARDRRHAVGAGAAHGGVRRAELLGEHDGGVRGQRRGAAREALGAVSPPTPHG